MNECIDLLGKAKMFSKLDGNPGYWQIDMDKIGVDETAFVTHNGLFKYARVPFVLKSTPVTFQNAMDVMLASVKWQHAFVYINYIIIFSKTEKEHL